MRSHSAMDVAAIFHQIQHHHDGSQDESLSSCEQSVSSIWPYRVPPTPAPPPEPPGPAGVLGFGEDEFGPLGGFGLLGPLGGFGLFGPLGGLGLFGPLGGFGLFGFL